MGEGLRHLAGAPYPARLGGKVRRSDIISGTILTVLGLFTIFVIVPDQISGTSAFGIAPDVFPLTLIWATTVFAALLVANRLLNTRNQARADDGPSPISRADWFFIAGTTLFLAAGFLAITYLGFIAGGGLMLAALMLLMGERFHWLRLVLVVVIAPVSLYFVFWSLFKVPLP